jgi:hypothetical protein
MIRGNVGTPIPDDVLRAAVWPSLRLQTKVPVAVQ